MLRLTRRRVITGLAALTGGAALWALKSAFGTYYTGPVSDHFDGTAFFDPEGVQPRGLGDVLRWQFTSKRAAWPERVPNGPLDTPPPRVAGRDIRLSFVGHASVLIQTAGLNILTDPVWSERASPVSFAGPRRVNAPGIVFDALPPLDAVLVSHNHYDHLDTATLARLAAIHRARIITPLGNDTIMRAADPAIRAEAYDWGARVALSDDCAVTLMRVRHWSARGLFDRNHALWAGFVLETPAGPIFFAGDTGYGSGSQFHAIRTKFGPLRLALLPIGAYEPRWFMREQHMNPADAVQAFLDLEAQDALGIHYGTFQITDESIDAPVQALDAALAEQAIAAKRFRALSPGETWTLPA